MGLKKLKIPSCLGAWYAAHFGPTLNQRRPNVRLCPPPPSSHLWLYREISKASRAAKKCVDRIFSRGSIENRQRFTSPRRIVRTSICLDRCWERKRWDGGTQWRQGCWVVGGGGGCVWRGGGVRRRVACVTMTRSRVNAPSGPDNELDNIGVIPRSLPFESRAVFTYPPLTLEALDYFCKNQEGQRCFFQFETIINVLVSSFRFIWIPMSWVYDLRKYYDSPCAGIDFRRQTLTSTAVYEIHSKQ